MSETIFPPVERVAVAIPDDLRPRFEAFVGEKGWSPAEAVRILLAYGADALTVRHRTPGEVYNAWAAARAELAVLRHRAYMAYEAIRVMKLNITGLDASNRQFQRSLRLQYARRQRLQRTLAESPERVQHAAPSPPDANERHREGPPDA